MRPAMKLAWATGLGAAPVSQRTFRACCPTAAHASSTAPPGTCPHVRVATRSRCALHQHAIRAAAGSHATPQGGAAWAEVPQGRGRRHSASLAVRHVLSIVDTTACNDTVIAHACSLHVCSLHVCSLHLCSADLHGAFASVVPASRCMWLGGPACPSPASRTAPHHLACRPSAACHQRAPPSAIFTLALHAGASTRPKCSGRSTWASAWRSFCRPPMSGQRCACCPRHSSFGEDRGRRGREVYSGAIDAHAHAAPCGAPSLVFAGVSAVPPS